jgi:hypothetical protein
VHTLDDSKIAHGRGFANGQPREVIGCHRHYRYSAVGVDGHAQLNGAADLPEAQRVPRHGLVLPCEDSVGGGWPPHRIGGLPSTPLLIYPGGGYFPLS